MNKDRSNLLLMLLAMFFWGSNFNAASALAGIVPPLTAGAERFVIAALVFLLLRLWQGQPESELSSKSKLQLAALGVLGVFGFNFAFFSGLQTTSALNGALIMATSPLVTTLLAALFIGSKISLQHWIGTLLGFAGVTLVITGNEEHEFQVAIGDLYMMVACLCWSLYSVFCKKYASAVPPLQLSRWSIMAGAVSLLGAALWIEQPLMVLPQVGVKSHLILLYMSLLGSVLAYIFWLRGVQAWGPAKAALYFNLVPVFTLLVAVVVGDYPRPVQLVGMVLVIVGVMLGNGVNSSRLLPKRGKAKYLSE